MERPDANHDFERVWKGYHPDQVNRYIDELSTRLTQAHEGLEVAAALSARLAEAECELARMRAVAKHLPGASSAVDERITALLELAESQADEVRQGAERDARKLRSRANSDALRARRDFEISLNARRERERRNDEILRATTTAVGH